MPTSLPTSRPIKVAVTGAAGQIGYALLFRIASGQMFGADMEVELQLLELPAARPALDGVAMELDDCAFPLLKKTVCSDRAEVAFKDADWCLLVGAVPRGKGMERKDLLHTNGNIFVAQGRAIDQVAAEDAKVFVVGNPCNTNALIAQRSAPRLPAQNFFAMTRLDENRAKAQLAHKAGVEVGQIANMTIWGNHSATQYPDFFNATIGGRPVPQVISGQAWLEGDFMTTVQQRGAAIIQARGASSAASAANAIVESVHHLTHDTPPQESYSMCLSSRGQYGISEGLIFSYPCRTEKGTVRVVEGVSHNSFGQEKLNQTHQELRDEEATVRELGLI